LLRFPLAEPASLRLPASTPRAGGPRPHMSVAAASRLASPSAA